MFRTEEGKMRFTPTYHECAIFAEGTIVENEEELGAIGIISSGLKRVGDSGREVPEVTRALRNRVISRIF